MASLSAARNSRSINSSCARRVVFVTGAIAGLYRPLKNSIHPAARQGDSGRVQISPTEYLGLLPHGSKLGTGHPQIPRRDLLDLVPLHVHTDSVARTTDTDEPTAGPSRVGRALIGLGDDLVGRSVGVRALRGGIDTTDSVPIVTAPI